MSVFHRREFLARTALLASASALSAVPSRAAEETKPVKRGSANDRLRVAVVGVNGRGMSHVGGYLGKNNCEIVAVCDCDEAVVKNAMTKVQAAQGEAPRFVQDFRKLLDDKSIDVISVPRRTTGTRSWPSGRCGPASTSMSRSRPRTTSARGR